MQSRQIFHEHDCIRLIQNVEDDGEIFPAGTTGAIVSVYNDCEAFAVEVVKNDKESSVITVFPSQLEVIS
ncbi:MAG: DUF4926 domain-containing protein [Opitutaceae bacterium]|jgi:hypothetical protein